MSEENSNVQATPEAAPQPPVAAGSNADELAAKVAELEKAREGLIRDLQKERSTRQELEQRVSSAAPSPVQQQDVNDELARVLNPYIEPLKKQVEELRAKSSEEKAWELLQEKTGKKRADLEADTAFQEKLLSTARKWNLVGDTYTVTQRALELMDLEALREKEAERARAAQVASATSLPSGSAPAPVSKMREYSVDEFNRMPIAEFDRLSTSGRFRKDGDKFVYTTQS